MFIKKKGPAFMMGKGRRPVPEGGRRMNYPSLHKLKCNGRANKTTKNKTTKNRAVTLKIVP